MARSRPKRTGSEKRREKRNENPSSKELKPGNNKE
jgi:hypothetical protein